MPSSLKKLIIILKNKYVLTGVIFVVWMFLFDSNNLLDRMKDLRNLSQLENDKIYYRDKIRTDSLKLQELRTNDENLEKFAREQYLMKRDNEDIFVVIRKK